MNTLPKDVLRLFFNHSGSKVLSGLVPVIVLEHRYHRCSQQRLRKYVHRDSHYDSSIVTVVPILPSGLVDGPVTVTNRRHTISLLNYRNGFQHGYMEHFNPCDLGRVDRRFLFHGKAHGDIQMRLNATLEKIGTFDHGRLIWIRDGYIQPDTEFIWNNLKQWNIYSTK